ncbi:MAG: metallophosphoesterase [Pseudomonadota bacterium]|nr:metallophosphoesterase [Pseudomonadota bacterium]
MMNWSKYLMWITFTIIMFVVSLAVSGLITLRWTGTMNLGIKTQFIIATLISLVFMSPFILRFPSSPLLGSLCNALTYISYFLFVCVFLFFCFMIARDILWFILHFLTSKVPSPFQATTVLHANIGLLILVIILATYSLYEGTRVPSVRQITLYSDKIQTPFSLVSLPDIHIHRALSAKKLKGIIDATNALKPDVIALPGDIIDDRADAITDLVPLLADFKAPMGVFVVDGNHEVYIGTAAAQAQFKAEHITYLYNEYRDLRSDVRISGVPDIQSNRINRPVDINKALPATKAYTILMAHTPKMFDMQNNTADLQLSGHTHGGQIFPFHILAWLSNRYLAGLFIRDGRALYVSRGAGQWGPQMRLLAPSEITYIRILPKQ